ncbi:hypothetical protein A6S26_10760 [Nostoc sp. ATCC 43529]|nr:hypothetical protein A6S26_10760 [Nostoc sp. ATCC 43529]
MSERFTEKAIKTIMLAQEEARRLGHNFVGTEQILLGLIGEGTGIAAKVLRSLGVKLKNARIEIEKIIGRGSGFVAAEIPFTPRAKRVLELSLKEARQLEHNYIGTEHLLLGLIREGEGVAVRVLENLRVSLPSVRAQIILMLKETTEEVSSLPGFEYFTDKTIKVIILAQEEARRLKDDFVGPEQILLGVIQEGTGVAAEVLKSMGVNFKDTQFEVEKLVGQSFNSVPVKLLFTPKAKQVLEMSLREAQKLGHNYIGTEHLLLGLTSGGENGAVKLLEILNINIAKMRTKVISMLEVSSLGTRTRDGTRLNKPIYKCTYCSHEVISIIRPCECDICGSSAIILLD